jgi:cobalt-precorrin-5B (C1)-methyltransferase
LRLFRTGFSTGTCAAGAAKTAALLLVSGERPEQVEVGLPDGSRVSLRVVRADRLGDAAAEAVVRKDAGDDPDVTDGAEVVAQVAFAGTAGVLFRAGEGVGVVTRPGLQVLPGEPAINPVPRQMIRASIGEVTDRGVEVTIAIPGGADLARKTFNPRLGIVGGLSILGTSGLVRPFSTPALREALKCTVAVARASGERSVVLVPGRIGERAARRAFRIAPAEVIEAGNEWGFIVDEISSAGFERLLVVGHPGKLGKLAAGWWDTHSARSGSALPVVHALIEELLKQEAPASPTVEGVFEALAQDERRRVAEALAMRVVVAIARRFSGSVTVALVTMAGDLLGLAGEVASWR